MDFTAEIVRTSQRKLISNDNQYELVLRTNNPMIMDLGKLPSDSVFKISINLYNNNSDSANKVNVGSVGI